MKAMSQRCTDLIRFADGELDPERAEVFRSHLRTCAACRTGLMEAIQLETRLTALRTVACETVVRRPGGHDLPDAALARTDEPAHADPPGHEPHGPCRVGAR